MVQTGTNEVQTNGANDFFLIGRYVYIGYIDDVLFGAKDIPLLKRTRDQLCSLLSRGKFKLRKWASNNSTPLANLRSEDHSLGSN